MVKEFTSSTPSGVAPVGGESSGSNKTLLVILGLVIAGGIGWWAYNSFFKKDKEETK